VLAKVVGEMGVKAAAESDGIRVALARLEMVEGFRGGTKMARRRHPWLKARDMGPSRELVVDEFHQVDFRGRIVIGGHFESGPVDGLGSPGGPFMFLLEIAPIFALREGLAQGGCVVSVERAILDVQDALGGCPDRSSVTVETR